MLDIFNNNAFSMVNMTNAIQKLPHQPRRIGQLGLFREQGITTTTAAIEYDNGVLTLLETKTRGGPKNQMSHGKRNIRNFPVPHIPVEDVVLPADVQDIRAFGQENALAGAAQVINNRLTPMRNSIEATIEHLRIGAIKGTILDADGVSVLFDLFTEFGVTQKEVDFVLGTSGTDIKAKCLEVARHVEDGLGAAVYDHIHCFCSATFFDKLTSHAEVKTAYERWQSGAFLREDNRRGFQFANITFEEYRGKVGSVDFIPDGDARFFPVGVQDLFMDYRAPGNFMDTVNTVGQAIYARQTVRPKGDGVDLDAESNPLPICTRPEVLARGHSSN